VHANDADVKSLVSAIATMNDDVVPPILFRAAGSRSRGLNTSDMMDPLDGYGEEYHESIEAFFETAPKQVRQELYNHLIWNYDSASEFTSWSASLLFVLVFAIRRLYFKRNKDVMIYVMDTSKIKDITRIRRASTMLDVYDVDIPKSKSYDDAEYLIHGKLVNENGLWKAVPLEELIEAGLCGKKYETDEMGWVKDGWKYLCPSINRPKGLKAPFRRVQELRRGYFKDKSFKMSRRMGVVQKMAKCFGGEWEALMTVALLTLSERMANVRSVEYLMSILERDTVLPDLLPSFDAWKEPVFLGVGGCPETYHFMELLRIAATYRYVFWTSR
jgi:hypothetical protein